MHAGLLLSLIPAAFAAPTALVAKGTPIGFAEGTTGGGNSASTTVTSCSELESALKAGGNIVIDGMLSGCGVLDVSSDTTVLGTGADSGMTGGGLRVKKAKNVILQNLKMSQSPEGKDLIEIETSTNVWVDHCDVSNDGLVGDKDKYDGLVDAKRGSDLITVSFTKFHDHWKASLFGHSDGNASQDQGKLRVTYHDNHWSNINSRAPSVRFGTAHIFNSCYEKVPTSGVNSRMGANVLVENNSFTDVRRAVVTNLDSKEDGLATEQNNEYSEKDIEITQASSFKPSYQYSVAPASGVCATVKSQAGTGVVA